MIGVTQEKLVIQVLNVTKNEMLQRLNSILMKKKAKKIYSIAEIKKILFHSYEEST